MRRLPSVTAVVGRVRPRSAVPLAFSVIAVLAPRAAFANAYDPPSFDLAEPTMPPRVEIVETTPSPTYYRLPPQTTHFLSRTAIGAHTRLTGDTFEGSISA